MCTVSWVHQDGGYELFSNRDERLSRRAAHGPTSHARHGVRFIAPLDGECGGTWIGVNEFGVSVCLLNGAVARGSLSRGLLVLDLLSTRSASETAWRVQNCDLSAFAPFTLAVLEPFRPAVVLRWDGRSWTALHGRPPLTSSSLDAPGAEAARRAEFGRHAAAARRIDSKVLDTFHRSHAQGPSAYSPCMHRADAETVSLSRVRVSASGVEFFYEPDAPCRGARVHAVRLRP